MVNRDNANESIRYYLNSFENKQLSNLRIREDRKGNGNVRINRIDIDSNGVTNVVFPIGSDLNFNIYFDGLEDIRKPRVILGIYDNMAVGVTRFDTDITSFIPSSLPRSGKISCQVKQVSLIPGRYTVNIAFFSKGNLEDYIANAVYFDIVGSDFYSTGKLFNDSDSQLIKVLFHHSWSIPTDSN